MPTFPTISRYPKDSGHTDGLAYNPSIQSQAEDGVVISRARFSAIKRRWVCIYEMLTEADKGLLDDFQDEVKVSADTFTWTNPKDDEIYTVRLEGPINFQMHPGDNSKWNAVITVIEA